MQLELPRLDVMRAVGSCHDFWKRVTNDEYFEFRKYVEEATGRGIPAYGAEAVADGGEPPEDWARAQQVIDALEWSLGIVSLLLPDKPTAHDVKALEDRLEQGVDPDWLDIQSKVLQRLLSHLFVCLSGLNEGRIDALLRVPASA